MKKKLAKPPKPLLIRKETIRVLNEPEVKLAIGGLPTEDTCSKGNCCPEW